MPFELAHKKYSSGKMSWAFTKMDAMPIDAEFAMEANEILRNHGMAFPLLASAGNAEFVFYTHDLDRKLVYISDSCMQLLGIDQSTWLNRRVDFLTDHAWNDVLKKSDIELDPNSIQSLQAEIRNDFEESIRVQVWRRLVTLRDIPIGVVGMVMRLSNPEDDDSESTRIDVEAIRSRIASLTGRERQVVELVVRGEMNRAIATILNIAIRTVEARRSKAMGKMGAKRLTELVRMWIAAGESIAK